MQGSGLLRNKWITRFCFLCIVWYLGDSEETIARLHSQIERIRQEHQVQLDKLILQHHSDLAEVRKREEDVRFQFEHLLSGEAPSRVFCMEDSSANEGRESPDPQDESRSSDLPKKEAMVAYVSTLSQQIRDAQACTDELRALLESKVRFLFEKICCLFSMFLQLHDSF